MISTSVPVIGAAFLQRRDLELSKADIIATIHHQLAPVRNREKEAFYLY
jgi:hypothetical protein